MRIVVNDIAASEGGALSVLKDFYQEIIDSNDGNEWVFLLGDNYLEPRENIEIQTFPSIKKSWFKRFKFDLFSGKKIINKWHPDTYISLQNTATRGLDCKQFVYLHQSLPYQNEKKYSFFKRSELKFAVYQYVIGSIFNFLFQHTNSMIIVQSEWMRKNLQQRFPQKKIIKCTPILNISELQNNKIKVERNNKWLFFPAGVMPYKNHQIILDLLKLNKDPKIKVFFTVNKEQLPTTDSRISYLGTIPRNEVFELYQKCILIFPSYIETFGLPLLEAQFYDAPILAANAEFSQEILKKYPNKTFFNKYNVLDLQEKMIELQNSVVVQNSNNFEDMQDNETILKLVLKR